MVLNGCYAEIYIEFECDVNGAYCEFKPCFSLQFDFMYISLDFSRYSEVVVRC